MVDGHLFDPCSTHEPQGGQESVHSAELHGQIAEELDLDRLETAARIPDAIVQDELPDAVGDAAPKSLAQGIAPRRSVSTASVAVLYRVKKNGNVVRVVLTVTVHQNSNASTTFAKSHTEGRALAGIRYNREHVQGRVSLASLSQDGAGCVSGPIINDEPLVWIGKFIQHMNRLVQNRRDGLLLVVDGDE